MSVYEGAGVYKCVQECARVCKSVKEGVSVLVCVRCIRVYECL
jgi:hypothetical protein